MKILMNPQAREKDKIWYEIEHQRIKATINGISDTFDFRDMPDGELELFDKYGKESIETILPENPISQARKENGELFVEILFTLDIDEDDDRFLFPKPLSLKEFNDLMEVLKENDKRRKEERKQQKEEQEKIKRDNEKRMEDTLNNVENGMENRR